MTINNSIKCCEHISFDSFYQQSFSICQPTRALRARLALSKRNNTFESSSTQSLTLTLTDFKTIENSIKGCEYIPFETFNPRRLFTTSAY